MIPSTVAARIRRAGAAGIGLLLMASWVQAGESANAAAAGSYKPTIDDWVGVNAAVGNYTLGMERRDPAVFDKAFWPEAVIITVPGPGISRQEPYKKALEPPMPAADAKPPLGIAPGARNVIGTDVPPWHLALNHQFEFQSATRATHYGYYISVYPDLKTKITTVGLPGHYEDVLEKRGGEWRILQRTTAIGAK